MNNSGFRDLGLSKKMRMAIADMGFEDATPIQSQSIPPMLAGRDVVGQAHTGTGKTAAFGIVMLEQAKPGRRVLQAVVLCPPRELAIQVSEEIKIIKI